MASLIEPILDPENKDFNGFIAYFRSIDITDHLGGDRGGDPNKKGQHMQIHWMIIIYVIFSGVYWLMFFALSRLYDQTKYRKYLPTTRHARKLVNHSISTLHALYSIISWSHMVWVSCTLPATTMFTDNECFDYTSPAMELYFIISLSYFVNDGLSLRMVFGNNGRTALTYFHHGICIVGVLAALIIGRAVGIVIQSIFITEISTIFVNLRFIMKDLKIDKSEKYVQKFLWNGLALNISFFLLRIVFLGILLCGYILPFLINQDYQEAISSLGEFRVRWEQGMLGLFFVLYLLNIYWFTMMVKGSYKFMQDQKKLKQQQKYQMQIEFSTEQHTEELDSDRHGRPSDIQNADMQNESLAAV